WAVVIRLDDARAGTEDELMKMACRLMAGLLAVAMSVPTAVFAGSSDESALSGLPARMNEERELDAIAANKEGYVRQQLERFLSLSGAKGNDNYFAKGTRRLMRQSPQALRQLGLAKDADTFRKLAFEGYTIDSFGQLTQDLVFFPINACRIYDSRTATAIGLGGAMAPGTQREISVNDSTSVQGGSATACDTLNPDLVNDPPPLPIT